MSDHDLADDELRLFQELLYRHAGIRLADAKRGLVVGRLRKRLEALGLESFRAYHARLGADAAELQRCLEALTTNETYFFRHKQHWDCLLGEILPQWRTASAPGAVFRAWSAASSTGEEPYSLAIALDAGLGDRRWTIDATDINTQVLERARAGIYGPYALQKVTEACRARAFTAVGPERWQVRADLRTQVAFRAHNLLHPLRGAPYDLILVRNVLIYFDAASKAVVLRHLVERLAPRGWLILGGAESLSDPTGRLAYVRPTIYRNQP